MKKILIPAILIFALLLGACSAPKSNDGPGDFYPEPDDGKYSVCNSESYLKIEENPAVYVAEESTVTFSLKVDTGAYSNITRYIESGMLPPKDAVRTEELINYFRYDAPVPITDGPFGIYTEVGPSPLGKNKFMAFVRVKTQEIDKSSLPASNLTFLIDTSGSMSSYDKLPLLKTAFRLLAENLGENDRVSIVTYAGASEVVLDSASGGNQAAIINAIDRLDAGGSTAGASGILTAYSLAQKNFMKGKNNRVILATDGDFNVGISNVSELETLISQKRETGIYLSVLGVGTGNIREDIMESLAKNGNGNYNYLNSVRTAQKVLVEEMGANLFTVADDVKAQIEFNQALVKTYRLIGYENRRLANEDFANDQKDAGEIGAGADVVAMFEIELNGLPDPKGKLFDVRIRYKYPGQSESKLIVKPSENAGLTAATRSSDFGFACSVAAFGHLLRGSEYTGQANIQTTLALAQESLGNDPGGYRADFVALLKQYQGLVK